MELLRKSNENNSKNNKNRDEILDVICNNPGIMMSNIARKCSIKRNVGIYHCGLLMDDKKIRKEKDGKYTRYYHYNQNTKIHPKFVS